MKKDKFQAKFGKKKIRTQHLQMLKYYIFFKVFCSSFHVYIVYRPFHIQWANVLHSQSPIWLKILPKGRPYEKLRKSKFWVKLNFFLGYNLKIQGSIFVISSHRRIGTTDIEHIHIFGTIIDEATKGYPRSLGPHFP